MSYLDPYLFSSEGRPQKTWEISGEKEITEYPQGTQKRSRDLPSGRL